MFFPALIRILSRFFDFRPGEVYRVVVVASVLFFLIAANNLIKIVRDSIFLSDHPVSELPYLYILVALLAGTIIAIYTRYIANLPLTRLILVTNAVILSNIAFFWFLLTFFNPGWGHYAFYIWSAMAVAIAVAQLWTLANQIFTPDEGKRLFGFLAAGGTLGGAAAGFGAKWALKLSFETNHLLWFVAALFFAASALVFWADRRLKEKYPDKGSELRRKPEEESANNIGTLLGGSRFLKTIAVLTLISVIVSTLIDFQFKAAAKQTHPSKEALASFFSSYYAWLNVATFFAQVVLNRIALNIFGLIPSLYLTPGALLAGSLAIMAWPSLFAAALTRMAAVAFRNSVHRSSIEILYMPLSTRVKKTVKTFLEVVVERIGDATAGFIILLYALFSPGTYITYVHFICVALIFIWCFLIPFTRMGHLEALRKEAGVREAAVRRPTDR